LEKIYNDEYENDIHYQHIEEIFLIQKEEYGYRHEFQYHIVPGHCDDKDQDYLEYDNINSNHFFEYSFCGCHHYENKLRSRMDDQQNHQIIILLEFVTKEKESEDKNTRKNNLAPDLIINMDIGWKKKQI